MKGIPRNRRRERGVALLMALFALLILSAIGLGMMYSANTETEINANYGGSMRAYYAALSGREEARDRLRSNTANPIAAPLNTPTTAGGTIYIVNSFVDLAGNTVSPQPWLNTDPYADKEYCREFLAPYPVAATRRPSQKARSSGALEPLLSGSVQRRAGRHASGQPP